MKERLPKYTYSLKMGINNLNIFVHKRWELYYIKFMERENGEIWEIVLHHHCCTKCEREREHKCRYVSNLTKMNATRGKTNDLWGRLTFTFSGVKAAAEHHSPSFLFSASPFYLKKLFSLSWWSAKSFPFSKRVYSLIKSKCKNVNM